MVGGEGGGGGVKGGYFGRRRRRDDLRDRRGVVQALFKEAEDFKGQEKKEGRRARSFNSSNYS